MPQKQIEANDTYHVEDFMACLEKKSKVNNLVKWRGFPAKKDWTQDNYESEDSVGAKEELWNVHAYNPESRSNPAFNIKNQFFPTGF
jgi:hypothetical protein